MDQEAKKMAMVSAIINQNQKSGQGADENADGGANNLVVKDMPMIQFYSQLGQRG